MAAHNQPVLVNIPQWIEENDHYLKPPFCRKTIYDKQMKMFVVGGPNSLEAFHLQPSDELFYMWKGDMTLRVLERGVHKNIIVKEGHLAIVPGRIHHSPQRVGDTIGFTLLRERPPVEEVDCFRYFVSADGKLTNKTLYEIWVHGDESPDKLESAVEEFYTTEQFKTGEPDPEMVLDNPPLVPHPDQVVHEPVNLLQWINEHEKQLDSSGKVKVFDDTAYCYQRSKNFPHNQVFVYGKGRISECQKTADVWIWQIIGSSVVESGGQQYTLRKDDSLSIPMGKRFAVIQHSHNRALVCYQCPATKKKRDSHIGHSALTAPKRVLAYLNKARRGVYYIDSGQ